MKKIIIGLLIIPFMVSCQNNQTKTVNIGMSNNELALEVRNCDIKTNIRPDGNIIKYFDPVPVAVEKDYELGLSIYKNETTDKSLF